MTPSRCSRFVVSGRVQGVFFRAATRNEAQRLGLTGWVRNQDDGTVEVVACGAEQELGQLENWLWQGPPNARVTAVTREAAPDVELRGFDLRY
ncbi:MAG: acylphosphatase [Acidiferrobacterales bacterium]